MSFVKGKYALSVFVFVSASFLTGCFDRPDPIVAGRDTAQTTGVSTTPPSSNTNTPPTISGTPSSVASIGRTWSFTPSASDPDGEKVTFKIKNQPTWAAFNNVTGHLTGVPQTGEEGSYGKILISVTDGKTTTPLPEFTVNVREKNANGAPEISGIPSIMAVVGQPYDFLPLASDPDGDSLIFDIANRPIWAEFDSTTGRLNGTPQPGDTAVYENIVVSVTDGEMSDALPGFSVNVTQGANGSVTLTWIPPSENEDGSALVDLAAYKVYYGVSEGDYSSEIRLDNPGISSYVVSNLAPNTYYFVSTAINSNGLESDFSNAVSTTVN